MSDAPRYVVGIDLGTTNCAVAFVDTERGDTVETFDVPQLVAAGQVEGRRTLPSFLYRPAEGEFPPGSLSLPWGEETGAAAGWVVGTFARDHGARVPGRQVSSSKSWLCHAGVDRTADLLPWHAAGDVDKLSPVEAGAALLAHVRAAWDHARPHAPLAEQDVVLTLPASFDEVARELTVRAARAAGLPRVVLIEEPQAAFYAWLANHPDTWHTLVEPGRNVLVCDIGGGTSDFTLIRVRPGGEGRVAFHRVAVGEHLILGGDNLDLALAHWLEASRGGTRDEGRGLSEGGDGGEPSRAERDVKGATDETGGEAPVASTQPSSLVPRPPAQDPELNTQLTPRQWDVLVRQCRFAKETLLGPDAPATLTVNLPGAGAKLLGGGLQITADRDAARAELLGGFLPEVDVAAKPRAARSGFREIGLPYAADPAVTKHLAKFLAEHGAVASENPDDGHAPPAVPHLVLFNGGFFASPVLRERLLAVLTSWFVDSQGPDFAPTVLANDRLDLAVSRGAAYYGLVRRGAGVRIEAGLARTYYIGVEAGDGERGEHPPAVCLIPAGTRAGETVDLAERPMTLRTGEPVELPVYASGTRLTDRAGDVVAADPGELSALPPIRTVLKARGRSSAERSSNEYGGDAVPVVLEAGLTEIGTLDLAARERLGPDADRSPRRWRLQFDVRSTTQTDVAAHESAAEAEGVLDEATAEAVDAVLHDTFGPDATGKPRGLNERIAAVAGGGREAWPSSLLRRMWHVLVELEPARRRSPAHEIRWLNLLGWSLRPGYGFALDDWRVAETWKRLHGKLAHADPQCVSEFHVLWRRVAGGLESGQQKSLADPLRSSLKSLGRGRSSKKSGAKRGREVADDPEVFRLLGALERLAVPVREELGAKFLDLAGSDAYAGQRDALWWAVGRTGARVPQYGPANSVVPAETAAGWVERLMDDVGTEDAPPLWPVVQLARRTGDRYLDLPQSARDEAAAWLERDGAPPHWVSLVTEGGTLDREEAGLALGDALPAGLRLG